MKMGSPVALREDEEWLSPAYQLLAAVLFGDNPEQTLNLASDEVLKALIEHLEECGVREEFGLSAIAATDTRISMIHFIEEFAQKGTDQMRLSGALDVVMENEPRHNAGASSLEKAGFGIEEDGKGNRVSHVQTRWDSSRTLLRGTRNPALRLPAERAHWLSPKKFVETNHRVNSRNIPPLMKVLIELSQAREGIAINGQLHMPDDIVGVYSVRSAPTYYINPIATELIIKKCGWAPPIPDDRRHWIPLSMFVEEHLNSNASGTNINRLSLLVQVFLANTESSFFIDGQHYEPSDLFGRYSKKGPSSYYINPVATDFIRHAIGWIPALPASRIHWQSSSKIAQEFHNGAQVGYYIDQLDKLAARLLSEPNATLNVGSNEEPALAHVNSVAGRFRRTRGIAAYFFNPDTKGFLQRRMGIFKELPADKAHYLSNSRLAQMAGLRVAQAEPAIEGIATKLRDQKEIDFIDPSSQQSAKIDPKSVIIEVIFEGKLRSRIYCEPEVAKQYFSKEEIFRYAAKVTTADQKIRRPHAPLALPIEKREWIPFSAIRIRTGIYKPTDPLAGVLKEYLQYLCDRGITGVGHFMARRGLDNGGTYFADPDIVGPDKLVNRKVLLSLQNKTRPQFAEVLAVRKTKWPHPS